MLSFSFGGVIDVIHDRQLLLLTLTKSSKYFGVWENLAMRPSWTHILEHVRHEMPLQTFWIISLLIEKRQSSASRLPEKLFSQIQVLWCIIIMYSRFQKYIRFLSISVVLYNLVDILLLCTALNDTFTSMLNIGWTWIIFMWYVKWYPVYSGIF